MVLNLQDLIYTFFLTLQWFESNTPPVKTILLFLKFVLSPDYTWRVVLSQCKALGAAIAASTAVDQRYSEQ